VRVGFDYHNVLDAWPNQIVNLMRRHISYGDKVYVISAIGPKRKGTIMEQVLSYTPYVDGVYEVAFRHPREAPALKTAQAKALDLHIFYDDRQDVVDAMVKEGILAFKVPRLDKTSDIQSDDIMK
jgi:acid phosphatase class B